MLIADVNRSREAPLGTSEEGQTVLYILTFHRYAKNVKVIIEQFPMKYTVLCFQCE